MPTMNNNSLIQIDGPDKGQCGMKAEASSAHKSSCSFSTAVSVFTATEATTSSCLNEGEMKVCAQVSVDAGESSLG